ncbi:hypothetical protein AKJ62_03360 [candidate division MSBL1 archaeon SCGC-AAA259D14]|nr:hypothetical protein AKJ62_03360 [candidate division MSBL1 archaeon SCGC-AAA259D14]KXA95470.1 hypothetical protein AKJ36_00465 [candidate division MSBL1 archaeon SCGC-AAA259I07]
MHPSKDILGSHGSEMEGQNVALCITGSVAAVRTPRLARTLMRHGAEVRVVMSKMATNLITPDMLHWATGNPVVTKLTGEVEHVEIAKWADMIVVVPATANTIGKIANGIDDTPPTSLVSVAQGLEKLIIVIPAMHESMYSHEIIQKNLSILKEVGVQILEPKFEEGKAKIPSIREMSDFILNFSKPKDLKGKRVLVTAGPTIEKLDPVRILTNQSSGRMGISVAKAALARGAEVTLAYGPGKEPEPLGVRTIRVETTDQMLEAVEEELTSEEYDLFVCAAAPQDFKPEKTSDEKLRRTEPFSPELIPTPSILERASKISGNSFLVGFKAECNVTDDQLQSAAADKMKEHDLDLVVANDLMRTGAGFGTETNDVIIVSGDGSRKMKASKNEIAEAILDIFVEEY